MTKSILPDLKSALEAYLDERVCTWQRMPEAERVPTLPVTVDGKVNVRGITLALGRPSSQEQHLFKKPELRAAINAVAEEQRLKPIGARGQLADVEVQVADRLRRSETRAGELAKQVAEQASVIEDQRRTIDSLREQVRIFEETGQVLRTGGVR